MKSYKETFLENICYTDLVYGRINKKLDQHLSKPQIETLVKRVLLNTAITNYEKIGKNVYVTNTESNIRLTINTFTNRIITADRINKKRSITL